MSATVGFPNTKRRLAINEIVPDDQILVCAACGKTSNSLLNFSDASCMSNSVLCYAEKQNGIYQAVPQEEDNEG